MILDPATLVLFVGASAFALALPGPTVTLVIARTLTHGPQTTRHLALGIALGTCAGSAVALTGAGALLMASATAFTIAKWIGAAYLIYLGLRMLTAEVAGDALLRPESAPSPWEGFWITLLNPKSLAFTAAFMPQFIDPTHSFGAQATLLIAIFSGLAWLNAMIFATGAEMLRKRLAKASVLRWSNRVGGSALVGFGLLALFARRPAA